MTLTERNALIVETFASEERRLQRTAMCNARADYIADGVCAILARDFGVTTTPDEVLNVLAQEAGFAE